MPKTYPIHHHATVWIPLPCGIKLAAALWLPDTGGPVPAILEYLPYRRRDGTARRDALSYPALAARGYAGVRVDIRGTGDSDGAFTDEYSETELSDGEAVIAWIAAQDWCDGHVGMMGISWGGFNALQLAARRPPALKAVISIASTVDRFADDIHCKGGTQLSANLYWATQMLARASLPPDAAVVGDGWRDQWQARLASMQPPILPWITHQRRDEYWRHGSICEDFSALQAPALLIAGWADGYRNTPWDGRAGLGDGARSLSGPWVHLYPHFATPEPRIDFIAEADRWFGRWLKGAETGAEALPAHRLWLAEAVRPDDRGADPGQWIAIDQGAGSKTVLHLAPGALGDTPGTDTLAVRTPLDCGTDGGEFFTQGGAADLPRDQRSDDGMSVCFETAPQARPRDIIGRPELRLRIAVDAPQANLVARLCDVHPDGTAHRISWGVLNLSHRGGSAAPTPMPVGLPVDMVLTLDATAYRLRPGHRLRLAVSTQYFPMVLPPPTDVTATLSLADCTLHLPTYPFTQIDLPPPPEGGGLPDFPQTTPAHENRTVSRDLALGQTDVSVTSSTGTTRHPEHGMAWTDARQTLWRITRGDPLSLSGHEVCRMAHTRNGAQTDVVADGRLSATATHWHVEARLTARLDGDEIFTRHWAEAIARDHV